MNFEDFFAKIGDYIFPLSATEIPNVWGKFKLPSGLIYCPRTVWKCIVKCSDCMFNLGSKDSSEIYEIIMFAYGSDVYFLKFNSVFDVFGDPWVMEVIVVWMEKMLKQIIHIVFLFMVHLQILFLLLSILIFLICIT